MISTIQLFFSHNLSWKQVQILRYSTANKPVKKVKYTDTVLLPKTGFPQFLNSKQVVDRDRRIAKECGFLEYYLWQQANVKGEEFILHDGPPYANGKPHIGHSINKILKDITLRSKAIQGKRLTFIPGWDCHGLPIELKALTNSEHNLPPNEVRQKARKFAQVASQVQMQAFKNWGVLGDWDKQCYYTFDKTYVVNQLQIFWQIFQKGLIYRDLKPVYWSPSSRTALAESELVYKDSHVSQAVTVRLKVVTKVPEHADKDVYLIVWTTTPWTLPANQAVCYSSNIEYSLVRRPSEQGVLYIMATGLVPDMSTKLKEELEVASVVDHEQLSQLSYRHPLLRTETRKLIEAGHVTMSGTGLVHTAPAHGHDDFLVGLKHGLSKACFVDENGCFTAGAGPALSGLSVLKDGVGRVVEDILEDVLVQERYRHSYPYDWRTDQPVIIRASQQWFIDTDNLKQPALASLKEVSMSENRLEALVQSRPYWCLSRQRTWGVPIPAFYHRTSGRPLVSQQLVDHLCDVFECHGVDAWWTQPTEQLFPRSVCRELLVHQEDVVRGTDIMDIWFDSGVSWSVLEGKVADVCIEGGDQYTGWFQSSLLTSVAARGTPPYRKLLTHGFAVDEEGRKMSKSEGNVLDPETVIGGEQALGVDTLRWWVAAHSHHAHIPVSHRLLQGNAEVVQKIRITLRFLLGALDELSEGELEPSQLSTIDRYTLHGCYTLYNAAVTSYNTHTYNTTCTLVTNFVTNLVSSLYLHSIKDRLYCDAASSARRQACRYVLYGLLNTLCYTLAPVLPHLVEEVFLHHPLYKGSQKLFYTRRMWEPPSQWQDPTSVPPIELVSKLKKDVDIICGAKTQQFSCILDLDEESYKMLQVLQPEHESYDSELTELLQVSSVQLNQSDVCKVTANSSSRSKCPRCRRYSALPSQQLCTRCSQLVQI